LIQQFSCQSSDCQIERKFTSVNSLTKYLDAELVFNQQHRLIASSEVKLDSAPHSYISPLARQCILTLDAQTPVNMTGQDPQLAGVQNIDLTKSFCREAAFRNFSGENSQWR